MAKTNSFNNKNKVGNAQSDCIVFVSDDHSLDVINGMVVEEGAVKPLAIKGTVSDAIAYMMKKDSPSTIVVDVSQSELPISDLLSLAEVCPPDVDVFVIGEKNDVGLYRDLKNLGVADYIVKPLTKEIIYKTLILENDPTKNRTLSKAGKLIGFWGARGGVGTTSILANMAWILSEEKGKKVSIVDTNLYSGTAPLYLNIHTQSGVKDILENVENLDDTALDQLASRVTQKLHVYSGEESFSDSFKATSQGWDRLIEFLQKKYYYSFIDLDHVFSANHAHLTTKLDILFIVADPSLASVRDVNSFMKHLRQNELNPTVHVILNKAGLYSDGELTVKQFAEAVNLPIDYVLPFDGAHYLDAINRGQVLTAKNNPIMTKLRNIVQELVGLGGANMPKKSSQSWISKIFSSSQKGA